MNVRPYDEGTAADFKQLFTDRFPGGDSEILDVFLSNPARAAHPACGTVAYSDAGDVIAIQGLIPRVAFQRQERILVANAVAMAVKKDVDRSFFTAYLTASVGGSGSDLLFGNTAIPGSRRRLQAASGVVDGPASCAEIREQDVRSSGFVARAFRKVLAKAGLSRTRNLPTADEAVIDRGDLTLTRECEIDDQRFNDFWTHYLKDNDGLVSSRTAEELRWMFAKGLAAGDTVLLTARAFGRLAGYVFCRRTDETGACWRIVDMIAIGNDERILAALVDGMTAFLRRRTPATCLQVTGFPTWVQPLLKRLFPRSATFGFNKCIWTPLTDRAKSLCGDWVNAPNGWYGCPYDGDMCLV